MSTIVLPDPMPDLRYWLRNDATLNPIHGGRVFFRLPKTLQAPLMRISRTGGGWLASAEAPLMDVQCLIEFWGLQNSDYQAIRQLEVAFESICHEWSAGTLLNPTSNTRMHNAMVNTAFDSPDPDTGWPRIVAHCTFTVSAITPTVIP